MRRLLLLPPVLILLFFGVLAASERSGPVVVNDIRMGVNAEGQTRLVLDVEGAPDHLAGPSTRSGLELLVHVENARFAVEGGLEGRGSKPGKGVIDQVFYEPNLVRVALTGPALPTRVFVLDPKGDVKHHRLVIDLDPASQEAFLADAEAFGAPLKGLESAVAEIEAQPSPRDEPPVVAAAEPLETAPRPSLKPAAEPATEVAVLPDPAPALDPVITRSKPLIVLDPGHGGHEPGAIGMARTKEKNVTLSFAQALKTVLEERGYEVMLTRSTDVYVPHRERIQKARESGADLFMSLHADSHEDHSLRGASVYTLSANRSEKMADELKNTGDFVLFDVKVSSADGVGDILLDLAQTNAAHNSDRLANHLVNSMSGHLPLLKNPKRRGALLVLLSPDVPAVLLEIAFLSNPRDEANLTSTAWRRTAVNTIANGIDSYFADVGIEARLAGANGNSG
ncbi:MAG: N-acetylmuramoyl-L-alanine amidase [Parvularcula sp.]|jgi:N-acetylmuramoyl-L-alanine amidase|nr:N-acetylmuramoyl-L-alanine amidase [Parvularcula sp.]